MGHVTSSLNGPLEMLHPEAHHLCNCQQPMPRRKFPSPPSVGDRRVDRSVTRSANSSSLSIANATLDAKSNDNLISWIDSLKLRVASTLEQQKNELLSLRKESHIEHLRRKYREQIDSESFDKLGEYLLQEESSSTHQSNQNQSGVRAEQISTDGQNSYNSANDQNESEDDVIEILSEEEEEGEEDQESEQYNDIESADSFDDQAAEDDEEDEVLESDAKDGDSDGAESGEYDDEVHENVSMNFRQIAAAAGAASSPLQISYHLQNGRPRLSDVAPSTIPREMDVTSSSGAEEEAHSESEIETDGLAEENLETMNYGNSTDHERGQWSREISAGESDHSESQEVASNETAHSDLEVLTEENSFASKAGSQSEDDNNSRESVQHINVEIESANLFEAVDYDSQTEYSGIYQSNLTGSNLSDQETPHELQQHVENEVSVLVDEISAGKMPGTDDSNSTVHKNGLANEFPGASEDDPDHNFLENNASETSSSVQEDFVDENDMLATLAQAAMSEETEILIDEVLNGDFQDVSELSSKQKETAPEANAVQLPDHGSSNNADAYVQMDAKKNSDPEEKLKTPRRRPIFQSLSPEDPKVVFRKLRRTEKKFNIKLEAVQQLKSELGSDAESDSSVDSTGNPYYDAEIENEVLIHQQQGKIISNTLASKPNAPILSELETESSSDYSLDDEESSKFESSQDIVIEEPQEFEEVVVLYDEFTEFVFDESPLAPTSVEEPVPRFIREHFPDVALEIVENDTLISADTLLVPTGIVEPLEQPEQVLVEIHEDIDEVILPTLIEEADATLSNEAVQSTSPEENLFFTATVLPPPAFNFANRKVEKEKQDADKGSSDESPNESEAEDVESQAETFAKTGVATQELQSSRSESPMGAEYLDNAGEFSSETQAPASDHNYSNSTVNFEDLETYSEVELSNCSSGDESTESYRNQKASETAEYMDNSEVAESYKKRKSSESEYDKWPVKRLKKLASSLNPFNWTFSAITDASGYVSRDTTELEKIDNTVKENADFETEQSRVHESSDVENSTFEDDKSSGIVTNLLAENRTTLMGSSSSKDLVQTVDSKEKFDSSEVNDKTTGDRSFQEPISSSESVTVIEDIPDPPKSSLPKEENEIEDEQILNPACSVDERTSMVCKSPPVIDEKESEDESEFADNQEHSVLPREFEPRDNLESTLINSVAEVLKPVSDFIEYVKESVEENVSDIVDKSISENGSKEAPIISDEADSDEDDRKHNELLEEKDKASPASDFKSEVQPIDVTGKSPANTNTIDGLSKETNEGGDGKEVAFTNSGVSETDEACLRLMQLVRQKAKDVLTSRDVAHNKPVHDSSKSDKELTLDNDAVGSSGEFQEFTNHPSEKSLPDIPNPVTSPTLRVLRSHPIIVEEPITTKDDQGSKAESVPDPSVPDSQEGTKPKIDVKEWIETVLKVDSATSENTEHETNLHSGLRPGLEKNYREERFAYSPEKSGRKKFYVTSSPVKSKRKRVQQRAVEGDIKKDEHKLDHGVESQDHPALRTRSRSPIKRSIQELSSGIEQEPLKRRRVTRSRAKLSAVDGEEWETEEEERGRTRSR